MNVNTEIEIDEQELVEALESELYNLVDSKIDEMEILQRDDVEYIAENTIQEIVDDAVSDMEFGIDKKVSELQGKIESLERLVKQIQSHSMRAVRLAKK